MEHLFGEVIPPNTKGLVVGGLAMNGQFLPFVTNGGGFLQVNGAVACAGGTVNPVNTANQPLEQFIIPEKSFNNNFTMSGNPPAPTYINNWSGVRFICLDITIADAGDKLAISAVIGPPTGNPTVFIPKIYDMNGRPIASNVLTGPTSPMNFKIFVEALGCSLILQPDVGNIGSSFIMAVSETRLDKFESDFPAKGFDTISIAPLSTFLPYAIINPTGSKIISVQFIIGQMGDKVKLEGFVGDHPDIPNNNFTPSLTDQTGAPIISNVFTAAGPLASFFATVLLNGCGLVITGDPGNSGTLDIFWNFGG